MNVVRMMRGTLLVERLIRILSSNKGPCDYDGQAVWLRDAGWHAGHYDQVGSEDQRLIDTSRDKKIRLFLEYFLINPQSFLEVGELHAILVNLTNHLSLFFIVIHSYLKILPPLSRALHGTQWRRERRLQRGAQELGMPCSHHWMAGSKRLSRQWDSNK